METMYQWGIDIKGTVPYRYKAIKQEDGSERHEKTSIGFYLNRISTKIEKIFQDMIARPYSLTIKDDEYFLIVYLYPQKKPLLRQFLNNLKSQL